MTVCIAAIYTVKEREEWGIWAVSDRRLTDGKTSQVSDPVMDKRFDLGPRAIVLSAGDSADDRPLMEAARKVGEARTATVEQIAEAYKREFVRRRQRAGDTYYLQPAMPLLERLAAQGQMDEGLNRRLLRQLQRGRRDDGTPFIDVDALIAGLDRNALGRPHIYRIAEDDERGEPKILDTDGALPVGKGADAASSFLAECGYVRSWGRDRVLAAIYLAKKRAQQIESVGPETDVFEITRRGRRRYPAESAFVCDLDKLCDAFADTQAVAFKAASDSFANLLNSSIARRSADRQ